MVRWFGIVAGSLLFATPAHALDGAALAQQVAERAGVTAFEKLDHFAFTWTHHPSGTERSYAWNRRAHTVTVTTAEGSTVVPTQGDVPEAHQDAHSAFINDSYWALFELHLAWDQGVDFENLGEQPVPGFDDLGPLRALAVQYGSEGGYTPGDRYVLYLGDDGLPVAWAFHRGGAEEASLVTLRGEWVEVGGVQVPTNFTTPDGKAFISIGGLSVR